MKRKMNENHSIDMLFVIALLFLFALGALMLIALGSSIYKRGVTTMAENSEKRTAYAYITEKLRQNDDMGQISIATFGDSPAIRIDSAIEDNEYITYLYQYDGALMELFTKASAGDIPPETGQRIMDIDDLEIEPKENGMLLITVTLPDGEELSFVTAKRSQNL